MLIANSKMELRIEIEKKLELIHKIVNTISINDSPRYFRNFYEHLGDRTDLSNYINEWNDFFSEGNNLELDVEIHIPFCIKKCNFCFLESIKLENRDKIDYYLSFLQDFLNKFSEIKRKDVSMFFLGMGTPNILYTNQLRELLSFIRTTFSFRKNDDNIIHRIIELNPKIVNKAHLDVIKDSNLFNRIEFGLQSLNVQTLKRENRLFVEFDRLMNLYRYTKNKGFHEVSFDLIYGLDGDSKKDFFDGLERLFKLKVDSIVVYGLQYHSRMKNKDSKFFKDFDEYNDVLSERFTEMTNIAETYGYGSTWRVFNQIKVFKFGDSSHVLEKKHSFEENLRALFVAGLHGFGYIPKNFKYEIIHYGNDNYNIKNLVFNVMKMESGNEIGSYVLQSILRKGSVDFNQFRNIFGEELTHIFNDEIEYLKKMNVIDVNGNSLSFSRSKYPERILYSGLFYSVNHLEKLYNYIKK